MAKSLMDFQSMVGTMVNMGFLAQQTERNDTYEQNSLMKAEELQLNKQRMTETRDARLMNFFLKMSDDPRVKVNPQMSDAALMKAWEIGGGPKISPDALDVGRKEMRTHIDALLNGDRQTAGDSLMNCRRSSDRTIARKSLTR